MVENAEKKVRALIAHPRFADGRAADADYDLEEAIGLAEALGVEPITARIIAIRDIRSSNFFGSGQVEEMAENIASEALSLVIVNGALSPVQQRNLERTLKVKVIDRTGLILEIFGVRAATKEGRLQVELARMAYERSRLVRTWTHLERQRGGTGGLAGPGETQIESDRRALDEKTGRLKRKLDHVRRTRGLQRKARQRAPERVVALVGYTNAGKSTLFNRLTTGGVLAKDMLFATLDTTHRVLPLPSGQKAVLSDTVGFISDLPTSLITAFRATLEEVKEADLLIHVRDLSDPLAERRKNEVMEVLEQIEAGPKYGQPIIEVWNKIDLLDEQGSIHLAERAAAARTDADKIDAFEISCLTMQGVEALQNGMEEALTRDDHILDIRVTPAEFSARAWLHQNGQVLSEETGDDGVADMKVRLSESDAGKFLAKHKALIV
ncbi:GTPase HflX [Litorimonas cladophorae]|uniref:GTPase HflX n=1 Tax=Litorimonas cladophorae TaxID=1220491 RepID=A0A918NBD2_9PROT|nr:GTPase HflX [Litorimonas cladophorae]GGX58041.1 GTPase HflX [Litorimonas cladophorae]